MGARSRCRPRLIDTAAGAAGSAVGGTYKDTPVSREVPLVVFSARRLLGPRRCVILGGLVGDNDDDGRGGALISGLMAGSAPVLVGDCDACERQWHAQLSTFEIDGQV